MKSQLEISLEKTISFAKAFLMSPRVSKEQIEARAKICAACSEVKISPGNQLSCGLCGCPVKDRPKIWNLARYEESVDKDGKVISGCKHPDGSRWKAAGV